MGRRTRGCCCCISVLVPLVAHLVAGPAIWMLLYTFLELVHDGIPWRLALSDMNYILDYTIKAHPIKGRLSFDVVEVTAEDDHVTAVCKTSLYLKITEVPGIWPVVNSADTIRTRDRLLAYVEACKEVYSALPADGEQRALLDGLKPVPGLPPLKNGDVLSPRMHGPVMPGEVLDFVDKRALAAAARPSTADFYAADGPKVQPVQPPVISASEIPDAIRSGKVAVFDATEILPKEVFNITWSDIARLHGEDAKNIPMYRQMSLAAFKSGWESLAAFADRQEKMHKAGKAYYNSFAPLPEDPSYQPPKPSESAPWWLRWAHRGVREALRIPEDHPQYSPEKVAHTFRADLLQSTVNSRRLPKLPIDMEKALGNPSWLDRTQPLLWSGAVPLWWHNDEPDNLLIGLNHEMDVAVFDPHDTDLISGARGPVHADRYFDLPNFHPDRTDPEWLRNNSWIHKFPFIRVRLKPGMGIVVPSRAYHGIWSEHPDRMLLNCFMIPKYKAMEEAPASKYSFFGKGRQPDLYMALFHLKMSSVGRLWDTRRLGGFFEMTKLESL